VALPKVEVRGTRIRLLSCNPTGHKDWTDADRAATSAGLSAGEIKPRGLHTARLRRALEEWVQILRSSPAVIGRPNRTCGRLGSTALMFADVYRPLRCPPGSDADRGHTDLRQTGTRRGAIKQRYSSRIQRVVADELEAAAERFVRPDPSSQAGSSIATTRNHDLTVRGSRWDVYPVLLADVIHHLWDVTGQQEPPLPRRWNSCESARPATLSANSEVR
jgi:hypothetical protein